MLKIIMQSRERNAMKMIFLVSAVLVAVLWKSVPAWAAEPKVAPPKNAAENGAASPAGAPLKIVKTVKTIRVHGNAFAAEFPERLRLNGERKNAWGTRYVAPIGSVNWFHVSIPIVSVGEEPAELKSVFLLFNAKNSTVEEVHLWDGATKIGQFTRLGLKGDNSEEVTAANRFSLPPGIGIRSGLGVSVGVSFGQKADASRTGEVIFTSVGAEYR